MKTFITSVLSMSLVLFGAVAPTQQASAAAYSTVINGSNCQPFYGSQEGNLYHEGDGTYTSGATWYTCPMTTTYTLNQTSGSMFIDTNFPSASYCYVYTYNFNDSYLAGQYVAIAAGTQDTYVGSIPDGPWYSHSVECYVPSGGKVLDYTANF